MLRINILALFFHITWKRNIIIMKKLLFLLLFVGSIGYSQDKSIEVPQILVKIPLGETIHFENASVKFLKVLEDSRCPKDVTCIWEGQARLLVEVTEIDKDPAQMELLFGGRQKKNILCSMNEYILKGISVSPYPVTTDNGRRDYALLVSEEWN